MRKILTESLFEYYWEFTRKGDPINDMGIGIKTLIETWMRDHDIKFYHYALSQRSNLINAYDTITLSGEDLDEFPEYIQFNSIRGGFHIDRNNLTSLRGCPKKVSGSFICSNNKLKNLIQGPEEVEGSYAASYNKLTSLQGFSHIVGESVYINNNKLKSLEGISSIIKGDLYIQNNPIKTLEYFPTKISGDLYFTESKILNEESISKKCKVYGSFYSH